MASPIAARAVLVVLLIAAVLLAGTIAAPFATAFFLAAVLAGAFHPWVNRLAALLRGRRALASGIFTLGLLLAVILPLAALAALVVSEVVNGIEWVRAALATGGIGGLLARLPAPAQRLAQHFLADLPGLLAQLQEMAASQGGRAAAAVGGLVTATTAFVIQATLMLVALFFLLVDGQRLVAWLDEAIPLQPGQVFELLGDFRKVTVAVLRSTLVTASVQTLVALVGYVIGRVPNTLFFTLVTFLVALVPVLGGSVGVVLVALLEFATGHAGAGLFLLLWVVPVSLTDSLVKPLLMGGKGGLEIHGAVIFFSLLGGIAAFGLVGVLIGPLVVAFLVAVLRMTRRDAGSPAQAEPPLTPPA